MAQLLLAPELKIFVIVYADYFKMSGPVQTPAKGWSLVRQGLTLDEPTDFTKYLGCEHRRRVVKLTSCGKVAQAVRTRHGAVL